MFATAEEHKTIEPLFCFIIGLARHLTMLNDDPRLMAERCAHA